ncbi:MAG: UxaA family hydrolase, partial [Bacteroidales bacterium]|nr:UxaA family hydrolase [Bacteroidales bacterium]
MKYIKINPDDNVAVALQDLQKGEVVEGVTLKCDVPRGHKVVLRSLAAGDDVVKYGFPIGHVTRDAAAGTMVDHSCIKTNLEGLLEYSYNPSLVEIEPAASRRTFRGFRRADGQVGIRNQIWVIPTVGCVNGICQQLVERFKAEIAGREGSIDAVVAFPHNYGCSQLGPDHENTRTV